MRILSVRSISKFFLCVCLVVLSFALTRGVNAEVNGLNHVVLQLKWYHQFQFAGYYAAKEKGFYRDAGLDVEILEGGPSISVQDVVGSGTADFGVLGSELVALRSKGEKCVVLAPIMQHSIRTIIARKEKNIFSPHDLIGKALMLNKNELPEFEAMFLNEGIRINDLNIIEKTKTANKEFIAGGVDAINGSLANQPYLFLEQGIPYTLVKPINYGIDFYGDTLFTTEKTIKKKAVLVQAFMTASFRGWNYAFDHSDELIDLILHKYNAKKTRAHLEFEQNRLRDLIHPDLVEIGHNNPERWLRIKETYQKLGIVPADFSLAGFFYEDYLETDSIWIKRLGIALGVVSAVLVLIFLYNFQLRNNVNSITKKIQRQNEYLKITLRSIGDAVISTDRSGNVVTMNPIAETLTGWRLKEAEGMPLGTVFNIVNSKTREHVDNPVEKVIETGRIVGLANHSLLISRDGKEYQIADSAAPMKDAQESTIGVVMVFRDVTTEYENMKEIVNLGKFPDENPNPVMRVTSDGILRYANRGSRHLLEHWGSRIDGVIPKIWRERVALAVTQNHVGQYDEEYPEGFLSLVIRPIKSENYANIYGMDITEQKNHFNRFRTVMDSLDALVYVADMETYELLFINKYGMDIWGDITGKICWQTLQTHQTGPCVFCTNRRLLDADSNPVGPVIWEFQNTTNNEWYECRDQAIRWMDGRMVRLEIATNITERKRSEAQRKKLEEELRQSHKLEAIGMIAGGIAHDFNNILGIILGNTELALDDLPEDNTAAGYLQEVKTAGFRARDVVKQLLHFSRKSEEEKENINIRESLVEAVRLIRALIPTSVKILTDIPDENQIITADSTQFQQIMINLCTNAAHAMEEAGGVLSIGLSEVEADTETTVQFQKLKPGRYVQLTVQDTGSGIDPKIKDKIFDPYFTTKEVGKGTGMGLAVVLGIVKNHEGIITVDSEPGKGTVFKVLFPKADDDTVRQEAVLQKSPTGSGRILFVDDEDGMIKIGKRMLEKLGYSVETANDPLEALGKVERAAQEFDLVITDMTMPHMGGDRLAQKVREINPDMPVILTSGFSSKIDRETARERGIQKYVEKPFKMAELAQAIKEVRGEPGDSELDGGI